MSIPICNVPVGAHRTLNILRFGNFVVSSDMLCDNTDLGSICLRRRSGCHCSHCRLVHGHGVSSVVFR